MTIYLIFAIIGAFVLLISVFGGDHHLELASDAHDIHDVSGDDASNDTPKILSLRTMASFLLAFGVAGIVCVHLEKSLNVQLLSGFIAGIVTVAIVYGIMRIFYSQQGFSSFNISSLIGSNCTVITGTAASGQAMIRVQTPDGAKEYMCKEFLGAKLERNDTVTIKGIQDSIVLVGKVTLYDALNNMTVNAPMPKEFFTPTKEEENKIKEAQLEPVVVAPEVELPKRAIKTKKTVAAATKKAATPKKPAAKKSTAAKKFGPKFDDLPK